MASVDGADLPGEAEDASVDLGGVVLEQKMTSSDSLSAILFGILLVVFGGGVAVIVPRGAPWPPGTWQLAFAGALLIFGLVLLGIGIVGRRRDRDWRVVVHEAGIVERRRGAESAIRFDEVDELEYKCTRVYVNGAYAGTNDHLRVKTAGPEGRSILLRRKRDERKAFKTGIAEPNPLDPISNRISARLASEMAGRLDRGESIPWASKLVIHPDGIEILGRPWSERDFRDLFGKGSTRVGWTGVDRIEVDNGFFRLWVKGKPRPQVLVENGAANFLPGYRVVAAILEHESAREAAASPPPGDRDLGRGERIDLEFARTLADHMALDRHWRWRTPKGRKESLEAILILPATLAVIALLGIGRAFLVDGRMGRDWFVVGLLACLLGGPALAGLLELLRSTLSGRRVARQTAASRELAKLGKAADPFRAFKMTLGPLGFAFRTDLGELRRSWAEVARVGWDRGYIFIHKAADKVDPETIDVMIPPSAFGGDEVRAREAFDRIAEWHRAKVAG